MGVVFDTHVSEAMVFLCGGAFPLMMGTIFRTRVSRNSLLRQLVILLESGKTFNTVSS